MFRLEEPALGYLAKSQLAAWEVIARTWPVSYDAQFGSGDPVSRRDRTWRCGACSKGVALAFDDQWRRYEYTDEQWLALVVLHLRNHHVDLDPDKAPGAL